MTLRIFFDEDTASIDEDAAEGITLTRNKGIEGSGDTLDGQVIGQWHIGLLILEFSADGEMRMTYRGEQYIGTYKIIGNDQIEVNFPNKEDPTRYLEGLSDVRIVGNEITIITEFDVLEGYRVK